MHVTTSFEVAQFDADGNWADVLCQFSADVEQDGEEWRVSNLAAVALDAWPEVELTKAQRIDVVSALLDEAEKQMQAKEAA